MTKRSAEKAIRDELAATTARQASTTNRMMRLDQLIAGLSDDRGKLLAANRLLSERASALRAALEAIAPPTADAPDHDHDDGSHDSGGES